MKTRQLMSDLQTALVSALEDTELGAQVKRAAKVKRRNQELTFRERMKKQARDSKYEKALELAHSKKFRGKSLEELWDIVERLHDESS